MNDDNDIERDHDDDLDEESQGDIEAALDYIGAPKRGRGRPPKASVAKQELLRPQTVSFIAAALNKDRRTVERKLAGLEPAVDDGKVVLYDFAQACQSIFRGESALSAAALADLRPDQLPPATQAAFWNAQKSRIAVYQEAGLLWRENSVLAAFDAVIKTFRDGVLALPERLKAAERAGLTSDDVARVLLEAVEDQAAKALRELKGQDFSAELALVEELMEAGDGPDEWDDD